MRVLRVVFLLLAACLVLQVLCVQPFVSASDDLDDFYADQDDDDLFDAELEKRQLKKKGKKGTKKKKSPPEVAEAVKDPPAKKKVRVPLPPLTLENYFYEFLLINVVGLYVIMFLFGRGANAKLAQGWLTAAQQEFTRNFAQTGVYSAQDGMNDAGEVVPVQKLLMLKESDQRFIFYATGHKHCWSVHAAVELVRRQDLLHYLLSFVDMATAKDTVTLTFEMDASGPACVMAIAKKKQMAKVRELDAGVNALANPVGSPRLASKYALVSDTSETERFAMSDAVIAAINESKNLFQHAYYTDRFVEEEVNQETGERKRVGGLKKQLVFQFALPAPDKSERVVPLVRAAMALVTDLAKLKISARAADKCAKARKKLDSAQSQQSHAQRQEEAKQRKMEIAREKEIEREAQRVNMTDEQKRKRDIKDQAALRKRNKPKMRMKRA
jgi:hypothetical protein